MILKKSSVSLPVRSTGRLDSGKKFRGVYDRDTRKVLTFSDTMKGAKEGHIEELDVDDAKIDEVMDSDQKEQLMDEIELLDGASAEFDMEAVSCGKLSPVFFGSALTNLGVETFLQHFLTMTTSPLPRTADCGVIDPMTEDFSAFVFKIQANMNKAHRDRIAFMRICSGKFDAGMEVYHVQGDKKMRLSQPQQMMAQDRHIVEEAYAGDIIGVFDPGIFSIGDTVCTPGNKFAYEGIPTFAPEHFARVRLLDSMKRKQFVKGDQPDCPGRSYPDLPGIHGRNGRDHCRSCRCAAVRRVKIPPGKRIQRRYPSGKSAI